MWHKWTTVLLVCCALAGSRAEEPAPAEPQPVATTVRPPPRTLDRQAAELAWKTWLQSPESGNPNAPPRRITTKSLFITPLVCPKGQRLDRNGCVQVLTINKEEHERNLLAQLNALFTPSPDGEQYDYGDDEPGPLQLSIPIGLDPLASPLQGQEPSAQAQDLQENLVKFDKKDNKKPDGDSSIEAELELLKLQNNYTAQSNVGGNHNVLTNMHLHPKRDSAAVNVTETDLLNKTSAEVGQKEVVYGHVNIDPILYQANKDSLSDDNAEKATGASVSSSMSNIAPSSNNTKENIQSLAVVENKTDASVNTTKFNTPHALKKEGEQIKLNPENDYSDIGEAIKLISRYAEVTTDDNFAKDQKKTAFNNDSILGTRTRLQHRRNKPKDSEAMKIVATNDQQEHKGKPLYGVFSKNGVYYRYPWPSQHAPTPPPDYPFRHLQDYWAGRSKYGGVYNTHENPRRHHHSYSHNFRPHGYLNVDLDMRDQYPEQLKGYIHRVAPHHATPLRPQTNNQDLYSLLGLRHWFSSEGASKR